MPTDPRAAAIKVWELFVSKTTSLRSSTGREHRVEPLMQDGRVVLTATSRCIAGASRDERDRSPCGTSCAARSEPASRVELARVSLGERGD